MRKPFEGEYKLTQTWANELIIDGKPYYAQWGYKGHNGVDYGLPFRTQVIAPHNGKIIEASYDPNGYGNYVKIENDKEGSILAHLDVVEVKVGFQLLEGDKIGLSGNSGASTGPHLHWGYYRFPRDRQNGYGGTIDPAPYIKDVITYNHKITKMGMEVRPATDIPVGPEPGRQTFDYGRISPSAPAKVVEVRYISGTPYYNIDQTYLGGGTGWVLAKDLDNAPVYVEKKEEKVEEKQDNNKNVPEKASPSRKPAESPVVALKEHNEVLTLLNEYEKVGKKHGFDSPEELDKLLTNFQESYKNLSKEELDKLVTIGELNTKKDKNNNTKTEIKFNLNWLIELFGLAHLLKGGDSK